MWATSCRRYKTRPAPFLSPCPCSQPRPRGSAFRLPPFSINIDLEHEHREMAAVVRGPRAGRGGPGRAQGQRRGPAAAVVVAAPVPVPAVPQENGHAAPPNLRWTLLPRDNDEHFNHQPDQGDKIYSFLHKSPLVDRMELIKFGVSDALVAAEPARVLPMLNGVVDSMNMMMPIRQRYLYKYMQGERGSEEMYKMEKTLWKTVERVEEKIRLIKDNDGFCPPMPKLFNSLPKPQKK